MSDQFDVGKLTAGLGESWEIARNTYKPYPAGIVFHAVIDACLKLRRQLAGGTGDIESVTVQGSQLLLDRGDRAVNSERDARVSIHHSAACGLLLGAAGVREFSQTVVFEPAVVRFHDKVRAQLDASLPDGAALVTVRTASGKIFRETVMSARGSLADPLSDADIENKLRECIHTDGNSCDPDKLIEAVWRLEQLPDVAGLMKASRGEPP